MNFSVLALALCWIFISTLSARENPFDAIPQTSSPFATIPLIAMEQKNKSETQNRKTTPKITMPTTQTTTPPKPISSVPIPKPQPAPSPQSKQQPIVVSSTVTPEPAVPIDSIDPRYLIDCCDTTPMHRKKIHHLAHHRTKRKHKTVVHRLLFHNCFLTLKQEGNSLIILTKDPLQAKIYLHQKKALILDFTRHVKMKTQTLYPHSSHFTKVTLGSHLCFYRLTVHYHGQKPTFKRISKGYLISPSL